MEALVERLYLEFLADIEAIIGHKDVTLSDVLDDVGRSLFGSRFIGVFARNELPSKQSTRHSFLICNLDDRGQAGSHWVALANNMIYDSFGRELDFSGYKRTDDDAEQEEVENNCGQRCLAWLCVYDALGEAAAKLV